MHTNPSVQIGANVRAEMARRGLTQTALADRLHISQTQVSARLRGRVPFDVNELTRVAEVLGVSLSTLLPDSTVGAA